MGTYKSIFPVDCDVYTKGSVSSTEQKVIDAKGFIVNYYETITYTSAGLSVSTSPAYGMTYVQNTLAGATDAPRVLSLAAPIPGVEKTIFFDSTAAMNNTLDVYLGGGTIFGSSGYTYVAFSSLAEVGQSITLMGLTTALWGVKAVNSTLLFFGAATGIRGTTAARTS